jgi:hypothetical protein
MILVYRYIPVFGILSQHTEAVKLLQSGTMPADFESLVADASRKSGVRIYNVGCATFRCTRINQLGVCGIVPPDMPVGRSTEDPEEYIPSFH